MEGTMNVRSPILAFALAATGLMFACDGGQEKVVGPEDIQPQFAKPEKCDPWPQCQDDGGAQSAWSLVLAGAMESDPGNPDDAGVGVDNKHKFTASAGFDENSHKVWLPVGITELQVDPTTCDNPGYTVEKSAYEQLKPFLEGSDDITEYTGSRVVVLWVARGETEYRIMVLKKDLDYYPHLGYPAEGVRSFGLYLWGDGAREKDEDTGVTTVTLPVSRVVVNPPSVMGGGWFSCDAIPGQVVTATFTPISG
jgi:hypothetical protein